MLKPRSFNVYKNAIALIIAILGCLEVDMEVLNTGIKTIGSDNCRGVSEDNRDTNGVLATTHKKTRFFYKDR